MEIKKRKKCAICGNEIKKFLDLGKMPLANHLLTKEELGSREKKYLLTLCFCEQCSLVQLGQIVSPEIMFKDYLYVPSQSMTLVSHFEELFKTVSQKKKRGFVIDIGSNDGTLLRFFKNSGYRVLGVDPAEKIAVAATASGIETIDKCFSRLAAREIVKKYGQADVVTATNVFAHVENLINLYHGVATIMKDDAICVAEVSYIADMVKKTLFDSIYHEHLYYFSVTALYNLFGKTPLKLIHVDHIPMHGGSLRLWLNKRNNKIQSDNSVQELINYERKFGIKKLSTYCDFKKKILKIKKRLNFTLKKIKKQKKKIVGFGAPAKGNILLNYFGIGSETIDYLVDSTSYKQFRFTPGNYLQILPEETIYVDKPDYLLVLAWNFAPEIIRKHKNFGGKFIIPLPKLKIYPSNYITK